MAFYLKEDLSEVYYIFYLFTIDANVKCSSFEDIYRGRIEEEKMKKFFNLDFISISN
jgi:hypothetical protein